VVPLFIVKLTAQLTASEGSQVAASIHEKLCLGDIVIRGQAKQKRLPQKSKVSDV